MRSLLRPILRGLHSLRHPERADRDADDEVQHFAEQYENELIAGGMPRDDAHRLARARMGHPTVVREQVRASGWENVVESFLADLRYALRRLGRSPAFTAVAVVTLALGIGSATAIFSAVDPVLLRALPYPGAERLVSIDDRAVDGSSLAPTYGTYLELAARARSFESIAAGDAWRPSLLTNTNPERLAGERVTPNYFRAFGVRPVVGREFTEAEDSPHGARVVIVSDRFVQRRFAGDRSVLGRSIDLNGEPYQIVGIMPRGFTDVTSPSADVWTPMQAERNGGMNSREWGHHYHIVARLAARRSVDDAMRELATIADQPMPQFTRPPWASMRGGLMVQSLQRRVTEGVRPVLYALLVAVALVLIIVCVNVTNLLIARGAERRPEFAVRAALGAGGRRLVRQMLTESFVLSSLGAVLGLLVARVGVRALIALSPPDLPRVDAIRLDATAFAFAFAVTALVTVVVGLVPALAASRADFRDAAASSRSVAGSRSIVGSALLVAEVALALVLLVSAGLLVRSLDRLFAAKSGIDPSRVVTMQLVAAGERYATDDDRRRYFTRVLAAVRAVPGVTDAASTTALPLSGDVDGYGFETELNRGDRGNGGSALRAMVSPEYFAAMRIPLERGRLLSTTDIAGAPEAVVVSESFAKRVFGGVDAVGQRVRFGPEVGSGHPWATVVGVAGDVRITSLDEDPAPTFYVTPAQWVWTDAVQSLVVRTAGEPAPMIDAIRAAAASVDPTQPIQRVATMDAVVERSVAQRRFASTVFQAFGLVALLLAAVGLYGVFASGVAQRTREIGIRAALGATSGAIVGRILRRGLALTAAGVVAGAAIAGLTSRLLETLLYGVSRADPVTYAAVVALLGLVTLAACWVPARRAAAVDPALTLRGE